VSPASLATCRWAGIKNADDVTQHSCCNVCLGTLVAAWLRTGLGWA
jgi:hypothetical protein